MEKDRLFDGLERLVSIIHLLILFLAALAFSFVFIINWEDWFFGIKLAGWGAGLFLAARVLCALVILYLITQYPARWIAVLPASIAYFGFLFANAVVTYQTTAPGAFPSLFALLVAVPVLLLILKLLSATKKKEQEAGIPETRAPAAEKMPPSWNPFLFLFLAFFGAMVFAILVIPFSTALIVSNVPFLHRAALPPAHDTLLFKVSRDGRTEWETAIPGYSLDFERLTDAENGSYLLFGTYFLPDRDDAQIRVLKIDREGRLVWDMTRRMKYGFLPDETAQIEYAEPSGPGATALLTNGMSLQIDREGNVTAGSPPSETSPQPAAEERYPAGFATGQLPSKSVLIRIQADGERGLLFPIEDSRTGLEIISVYSVNPTADGGYLVSAAVRH